MTSEQTKRNGIKFEVPLIGDGTVGDPYRPAIFDGNSDAYFHLESTDRNTMTATVWIDKDRSPNNVVESIRNEKNPLGRVLEETG